MDKKVFDYVKKYFRNYFPEKCVMMENEEINNIVVEVCKELKVYDRNQILESRIDDMIFDLLNGFAKKNRTKLWNDTINLENYVSKFIIDNNLSSCSEGITNYIIKRIVTDLIPYYNLSKMNKGFFDSKIKVSFNDYKNQVFNDIYNIIYKYVNNLDVLVPGLKNDSIAKDLAAYFIKNGSYNLFDELEKRKHNAFIDKYINKVAYSIKQKKQESYSFKEVRIDSMQYIYNYIIEKLDVNRSLSYEECLDCTSYINSRLSVPNKNRRGFTPEEIVSPMCVPEIIRYYDRYMRRLNSVERNNVPKKIKPKKKRRTLQRGISVLLLTASLLGVFGTSAVLLDKGIDKYKESVNSFVIDFSPSKAINEFDDYNYSYIFYKGNDAVKSTALNAVKFHTKVQDLNCNNSNYDYLGFYRAYENVRDDRLYIMDTMLKLAQKEALKNDCDYEFIRNVNDVTCYLEFAMDRLEDMGCTEFSNEKYYDVLFEYIETRNEHPGEEVLQHMKKNDRKLIEEIMDKYQEYSKKLLQEFDEIVEGDKRGLTSLSVVSRRGI